MVTEDRSNHSVEETDRLLLITDTDQVCSYVYIGILNSNEFTQFSSHAIWTVCVCVRELVATAEIHICRVLLLSL